jgi:hypothetical protein
MLCRFNLYYSFVIFCRAHRLCSVGNVLFQWKYPKVGSSGGVGFWLHILLMTAVAAAHLRMQNT